VALCLAVVEHIDQPVEFLREIRELLAPEGYLLLSTPNLDDWLIDFLPGVYDRFFFRWVHTWYFNQAALQQLAQRAGFSRVEVKYHHRFDLSNALHWLRDQRPTGLGRTPLLKGLDRTWAQHLEDLGRADFIYAWLY
jgi:2-polyprenyl-3-methyl-5-hydroxy-6-metoxy-1,4-benzoquinol methylase